MNIDLKYGFTSEEDIHVYLERYFGSLNRTADNPNMGSMYEFDKYNDKFLIEIKTRRINHNQYPSLMFGKNKYIKGCELIADNPNIRIIYMWRCYDGIYYWEHDASEYTGRISGRRDRGRIEEDLCIHIDQQYIKRLDEFI